MARRRIRDDGWQIVNSTPLPIVCFTPHTCEQGGSIERLTRIARQVEASGAAWISVAKLAGRPTLRACITSYRTTQSDIDALGDALIDAASWYANESHPSNTDPP